MLCWILDKENSFITKWNFAIKKNNKFWYYLYRFDASSILVFNSEITADGEIIFTLAP